MSIVHLNAPAAASDSIRFGPNSGLGTDVKAIPNGPATLMFIGRRTSGGDAMGLAAPGTDWWHSIGWNATPALFDDDGLVGSSGPTFNPASTDLVLIAVTMPATGTTCRFHTKNITSGAAAGHSAGGANGGKRAMTGSSVYLHFGNFNSQTALTGDLVAGAAWNVELTDAQIDECWANSRTSDLWNNSAGQPDFLVEGNTLSMVDLAGLNTFVSAGTATLDGTDPAWTFDGTGNGAAAPGAVRTFTPIPFMR